MIYAKLEKYKRIWKGAEVVESTEGTHKSSDVNTLAHNDNQWWNEKIGNKTA